MDEWFQERRFAAASGRTADGSAVSHLVTIARDGRLHHFMPADGAAREETFDVPELREAACRVAAATIEAPGGSRLIVVILAITAEREAAVILLQRSAEGWSRSAIPGSGLFSKQYAVAPSYGFTAARHGRLQAFYVGFPPPERPSVAGFAVERTGGIYSCQFDNQPSGGIDLLATSAADRTLRLVRLDGDRLVLYPEIEPSHVDLARRLSTGHLPAAFDFDDRSMYFDLPKAPEQRDASCITPMVDREGLCHGLFVRTAAGELYACTLAADRRRKSVAVLTGGDGKPAQVKAVRCAFYDETDLHLFAQDGSDRIWYAVWPRGVHADALAWDDTGHSARIFDAPPFMPELPYLFVQREQSSIDRIAASLPGNPWISTSVSAQ